MANSEPRPMGELQKIPERVYDKSQMTAVHGRFLLALSGSDREILNPDNHKIPDVTENDFKKDVNEHNFTIFNSASANERQKLNGVQERELPQAIDTWAEKSAQTIKQKIATLGDSNKENQTRWTSVISSILGKDSLANLSQDDLKAVYETYFAGGKESKVKDFVLHIRQRLNKDQTMESLDCIEWFSHIFGEQSAGMVKELIVAEIRLQVEPDFVKTLNEKTTGSEISRINDPGVENEVPILEFVYGNSEIVTPTIEPTSPVSDEKTVGIHKAVTDSDIKIGKLADSTLAIKTHLKDAKKDDERLLLQDKLKSEYSVIGAECDLKGQKQGELFSPELQAKKIEWIQNSDDYELIDLAEYLRFRAYMQVAVKTQDPDLIKELFKDLNITDNTLVANMLVQGKEHPDKLNDAMLFPLFEADLQANRSRQIEEKVKQFDTESQYVGVPKNELRQLAEVTVDAENKKLLQGLKTQFNEWEDNLNGLKVPEPKSINPEPKPVNLEPKHEINWGNRVIWGTPGIDWVSERIDPKIRFADDPMFTSPLTNEDIKRLCNDKIYDKDIAHDIADAALVYFSLPNDKRVGDFDSIDSVYKYLIINKISGNHPVTGLVRSLVPGADYGDIWREKSITDNYRELTQTGDKIVMTVWSHENDAKFDPHEMLILGMKDEDFIVWDPFYQDRGLNAIRLLSTADLNKAVGSDKGDQISVAIKIKQTP